GHGHISPILGYLPEEDLVFVGDVNARFRPFLVPSERLLEAMNTTDTSTGRSRGLLRIGPA
ncbi:MAG TPA: phytochelatin synthase family protein, partial [Opitutus sp.]|nr:phytochelatin synthase family protein [Opitutus sp.]